jgi:tetratricopeptide (TPR) repeat protein
VGLAELLTDPAKKARVLLQIAEVLRVQEEQERAWLELLVQVGEVARMIEDDYVRAEALSSLGTALAQAQQWERAEAVIRSIKDNRQREGALQALAAAKTTAGAYEELLHLLHRWWGRASTREDALHLFPLAMAFIPRYPELGGDLYEAFTWVDTCLRGDITSTLRT